MSAIDFRLDYGGEDIRITTVDLDVPDAEVSGGEVLAAVTEVTSAALVAGSTGRLWAVTAIEYYPTTFQGPTIDLIFSRKSFAAPAVNSAFTLAGCTPALTRSDIIGVVKLPSSNWDDLDTAHKYQTQGALNLSLAYQCDINSTSIYVVPVIRTTKTYDATAKVSIQILVRPD